MKQFKFAHILTMLSLVVVLASCGLTQPGYGEDYSDRPVRNRTVYMDPYYGNSTIVRGDPYSGRYYEVTPVDAYGYGYDPYSSYGNSRYYGRTTNRVYTNNNTRNNNTPRRSQSPQVQQQQPRESSPTINKAKSIIRKD